MNSTLRERIDRALQPLASQQNTPSCENSLQTAAALYSMQASMCSTALQQRIDQALQPLARWQRGAANWTLAQALAAARVMLQTPAEMQKLYQRIDCALQPLAPEQETAGSQNVARASTAGAPKQRACGVWNDAVPAAQN
jgi:hypothetical protein